MEVRRRNNNWTKQKHLEFEAREEGSYSSSKGRAKWLPSRVGGHQTDLAVPGHSYLQGGIDQDLLYLVGLTKLHHVGPVLGRKLLDHFGSAREVFFSAQRDLLGIQGIGPKTARGISKGTSLFEAEKELEYAQKTDIEILSLFDSGYPQLLKEIYDAPILIYKKGKMDLNRQVHVSIVGTRMPSEYGRIVAERFAQFFVDQGICVVSGLAFGIDSIVHRTALKSKGKTLGVLGHGFSTIYPQEHMREARAMIESGALVTEFGHATMPDAPNFPMRNRLISGMASATIVIEAGLKGGALITARSAFEQNRQVYAIPGDLTRSQAHGANILIRDQIAKLVLHPSEIMEDILPSISVDLKDKRDIGEPISPSLRGEEEKVLELIGKGKKYTDDFSKSLGFSQHEMKKIMLSMELKGLVRRERTGQYYSTDLF